MGFFGMNEEELKKERTRLNQLQTDLENKKIDLERQEAVLQRSQGQLKGSRRQLDEERTQFDAAVSRTEQQLAEERKAIQDERLGLLKLKAEAEGGFAEIQKAAIAQSIEPQVKKLQERRAELEEMLKDIAEREGRIASDAASLAKREADVAAREKEAADGFAARQLEIAEQERKARERETSLNERERQLVEAERKRDEGYVLERAELEKELSGKRMEQARQLAAEREEQVRQLASEREKAEQARAELDIQKMKSLEEELAALRSAREAELKREMDSERSREQQAIDGLRKAFEDEKNAALAELRNGQVALAKERGELAAAQRDIQEREAALAADRANLERRQKREAERLSSRENDIEALVAERSAVVRQNLEEQIATLRSQNESLSKGLKAQSELRGAFDQLARALGGKDPKDVLDELNVQAEEIARLKQELLARPGMDVNDRLRDAESVKAELQQKLQQLQGELESRRGQDDELADLRRAHAEMDAENKSLAQRAKLFEGAANEAQAEVERLRAAYQRPQALEDRKREIEKPLVDFDKAFHVAKKPENPPAETVWLADIAAKCDDYGLHFHPRILRSFHTALKTADWAPLTVLAGVSGTGKSELPRLYAHFGGLNFEEVAVQPNWDCQESMLGFFNSIDNKFDAQPVLRFLAQTQKKWVSADKQDEAGNVIEKYPGLYTSENLVLLDEMNLAHPELYFAEFLSKLESRRGKQGLDIPSLDVKVGAGLTPYQLPLGRNVLWVGTMNQDETTKSLSDKVLDRSIVIYFPRPTTLERRLELKPRDASNRGTALHRAVWESWITRTSNFNDEILPYKQFIEQINAALGEEGRALGHRVWQSIEYYMANYPDVRAAKSSGDSRLLRKAMDVAFEDQLVQKVMPKLRGINTHGTGPGPKCLQGIRALLEGRDELKELLPDFDLAMELGYGQFQWQSAKYLEKDEQSQ